jgi:hypothetical protein
LGRSLAIVGRGVMAEGTLDAIDVVLVDDAHRQGCQASFIEAYTKWRLAAKTERKKKPGQRSSWPGFGFGGRFSAFRPTAYQTYWSRVVIPSKVIAS